MKLNFIQNLSDEVLRENYELKTQIQQVRHQLNDYETEMIAVISSIAPNKDICIHPSEILQEFIGTIKQELIVYQSVKMHSDLLRSQYDGLQTEVIKLNRALTEKTIEADAHKQHLALQLKKSQEKEGQLQAQIQVLQQSSQNTIKEFNELKIEKLRMQEAKRKELEQIRHIQNSQIISFREKNEKEHMKKEKELKKELQTRDKVIKEMSKSIAELSNAKDVGKSEAVLTEIFKSFQSFEDLSQANKELKQQNETLREQVKDLYNRLIAIEANLQESKSTESDLQSRLERIELEKQEIENKLVVKIGEMNKSQKDKEALEKYYDQKWNSEYKRVKIKLEATYSLKIAELEEQTKLRMVAIQNELRIMSEQNSYFKQRNSQLEARFTNDKKGKENLNARIVQIDNEYRDFRRFHIQNVMMFHEEMHATKLAHEEEKLKLKEIIRAREESLKEQAEKLINHRIKHFKEVAELEEMYEQQISKQTNEYKGEVAKIEAQHAQQISKLKLQFYAQMDNAELLRKDIEAEFQSLLEGERNNGNIALVKKEEEMVILNKKWIDRYQELQNLYGVTRRKNQQEIAKCKEQISKLLESEFNLHRKKEALQATIVKLQREISNQRLKLQQCANIISNKEAIIKSQEREIHHCKNEVDVLLSNRRMWSNELLEVQRQFRNEFDQAKKVNEKQITLYKQRIMELEDIKRKNVLNQKTLEKLQSLQNESSVFKSQIHIKQAENIILHQVKDYYETKLKEAEGRIGRSDLKTNHHAILARKLKKNRITTNESISQRMFEPTEPFSDKKRYSNSVHKNYNLSLSKTKFQEGFQRGSNRVQTLSTFK